MISSFIEILHGIGLELMAEEIADVLWLASHLDEPPARKEETIFQAPVQEPPKEESIAPPLLQLSQSPGSRQERKTKPSETALYPRKSKGTGSSGIGGLAFRSPGGTALPGKLLIGRAFRPLMRRVPSRTQKILDEEATARQTAEIGNPNVVFPVFSPARSRWLDVVLVIDESPSMDIWQHTIFEFQRLLECQGAFRNVQSWGVAFDSDGNLNLHAGLGTQSSRQDSRNPRELIEPTGRRLLLVLSDCVSWAWEDGRIANLLQIWAEKNYAALVQLLPQRLWDRSALGRAIPIFLRTLVPPTLKSGIEPQFEDLIIQESEEQSLPNGVSVPIMTLEARTIFPWTQAVSGKKDNRIPGRLLLLTKEANLWEKTAAETTHSLPPEEHVQLFRAVASPLAWKLLGYLAAVPLSLPVMRLVQHVMLPETRQTHLAEVFLSGLIKRIVPEDSSSTAEEVEYDFLDGVRDILLSKVLINEQVEVLSYVSHFIDRETGNPVDFRALVADPTRTEQIMIEQCNRRFANVATHVLYRLGGNYARLAERLEQFWEEDEKIEGEAGQGAETQQKSEVITGREVLTQLPSVLKNKHPEVVETERIDEQYKRKKSEYSTIDEEPIVDKWASKYFPIEFVDRVNEIAFITNIYCPPYLLISAPAGYGKSRLLENAKERFQQQDWLCLYLKLSRDKQYSVQELAHLLLQEIGVQGSRHFDLSTPENAGDAVSWNILNTQKHGQKNITILIDEAEALDESSVKQLLNRFLPAFKEGINIVEPALRLRLICAGRQLAHWKQWGEKLPLELLALTPFDFPAVYETVRKFVAISDIKRNADYQQDFAAYLMYFTGGHPGCIMEFLLKNYGSNISGFIENESGYYQKIVKPVIEEIQDHIPEDLQTIFERLSVFRMYNSPLLQKIIDGKIIDYKGNAIRLERALIATNLVNRRSGFVQDDIVRRLFAIKLREGNNTAFIDLCREAQQIIESYVQETNYHFDSVTLEALFQELQLGYYTSDQTAQSRQILAQQFFAQDGIVQKYLDILLHKPDTYDSLQNLLHILQRQDDWEFQFTLNFFLRRSDHYTDEPYQRLLHAVEQFIKQQTDV